MQKTLLAFIFLIVGFYSAAAEPPRLSPADIKSKAFILVDADSRRVLAHYRATERLSPASITKLMTAYVTYKVLEAGLLQLEDKTIISQNARNMEEGSRMFLEKGSRVSINELLHGLVIQSGNDAAIALAEAVAGSEKEFVALMNSYAKKLGMNDSQFKNVTGLTDEGHYMSAQDIATLAHAIITEFPEHYKLYKQREYTWNNIKQGNRNALLRTDASVDGLKTGYTEAAGYCLVASSKRDDMRLISVVLGTASVGARARASKKVLNFGFNHFVERTILKKGQKVSVAKVSNGKKDSVDIAIDAQVRLPLSAHDKANIAAQLVLDKPLEAPVKAGQVVGNIVVKKGKSTLATAPAVTMAAVEEVGFFTRLWNSIF